MLQVDERLELRTFLKKKRGYRSELAEKAKVYISVIDMWFRGDVNSEKVETAVMSMAKEEVKRRSLLQQQNKQLMKTIKTL